MQIKSDNPANKGRPAANSKDAERERQLAALLDRLDAEDANDAGRVNRRAARSKYRRMNVSVAVHHPGGSTTNRSVRTRDLSAGGLSFIHNGYLHIGTRVDVSLPRYVGGEDTVEGRIVCCNHLAGTWHTVGVKFNCKVFPKLYLDPDHAGGAAVDATQPQAIHGRVLLLEETELDRRLFAHHVRKTRLELSVAESLDDAVAQIKNHPEGADGFDVVVAEVRLAGGAQPAEVAKRLMSLGCRVAVCSAETNPTVLQAVQEAGVAGVLRKPYEPEKLLGSLVEWLGIDAGGGDAIVSTLADQPDMRPLLTEFVGKAQALGKALAEATRAGDVDQARSICITLRGSGAGYGFQAVTDAATEALDVLESTGGLANAKTILERLRAVCGRVSDAAPDTGDAAARAA